MLITNMNPPTDHLPKWQKGQPSPNPNGRPPKFITTLKRQGYHAGDINRVILTILSLPEEKVSEIASLEEYTILERIIAKALINKTYSSPILKLHFYLFCCSI